MSEVSKDLVRNVANLARLKLSDDEVQEYQKQLSKVIGYFSSIDKIVDGLGKDWRQDTQGDSTIERQDKASPPSPSNLVFENAPDSEGSSFSVPKVIE